jgi:predicted acetyltransferase
MMAHHLADVAARGESLSLLYAAEGGIYGRFGYGTATRASALTLPRSPALRAVPGAEDLVVDVEHAGVHRHAEVLGACFERARRARPGWLSRDRAGVRAEAFLDPRRRRRGAESLRLLTVSTPEGDLRGYALFRRRMAWGDFTPTGTVEVHEVVVLDAAAAHALWSRLTDLDLTTKVQTPLLPLDDPLLHLLADPRTGDPRTTDGLWARVVDVPKALAQRAYAADVDVVLGVTDAGLPANAGTWHLAGGPDGATCTATTRPADVELDVRELGAAYFGGTTLSALAGAGLVRAADQAVLTGASIAFSWPVAPHCGWAF